MEIPSPYLRKFAINWNASMDTDRNPGTRKSGPSNLVLKLAGREIHGGSGHPSYGFGSESHLSRSLYQNITPNFSVTDIVQPKCFMRTFTPDGKQIIGFDSNFNSSIVHIYKFRGPQAANNLFSSIQSPRPKWIQNNSIPYHERDPAANAIRSGIFNSFFELMSKVTAAPDGFDLERECSLITSDSRYLIVAGKRFSEATEAEEDSTATTLEELDVEDGADEEMDLDSEISDEPEDLFPLDYCVSVIDINLGEVVCTKIFNSDKMIFTHNQGIYLYDNMITVFSMKTQTIHVFNISTEGILRELRSIGRFSDEAEEELFNCVPEFRAVPVKRERFLTSLSQQLTQYIHEEKDKDDDEYYARNNKPKFYKSHFVLQRFEISKIQLLDEVTLLMKYSARDYLYTPEPNKDEEYHFFVFYDMNKFKILKIEDTNSRHLAELISTHSELIRNTHLVEGGRFMTNAGNSINCRAIVNKLKEQLPDYHNLVLTHHLTSYCQSFTPTPYLDHNLFIYDTTKVNLTGRPRAFAGAKVHWEGGSSPAYNFHLTLTELSEGSNLFPNVSHEGSLFKLVFHPNTPFMFSLQRFGTKYYLNVHFRLDETILPQDFKTELECQEL